MLDLAEVRQHIVHQAARVRARVRVSVRVRVRFGVRVRVRVRVRFGVRARARVRANLPRWTSSRHVAAAVLPG